MRKDRNQPIRTLGEITADNGNGTYNVSVKGRPYDYNSVPISGTGKHAVGNKVLLEFNENNKNMPYIPAIRKSGGTVINLVGIWAQPSYDHTSRYYVSGMDSLAGTEVAEIAWSEHAADAIRGRIVYTRNDIAYLVLLVTNDTVGYRELRCYKAATGAKIWETDLEYGGRVDDSRLDPDYWIQDTDYPCLAAGANPDDYYWIRAKYSDQLYFYNEYIYVVHLFDRVPWNALFNPGSSVSIAPCASSNIEKVKTTGVLSSSTYTHSTLSTSLIDPYEDGTVMIVVLTNPSWAYVPTTNYTIIKSGGTDDDGEYAAAALRMKDGNLFNINTGRSDKWRLRDTGGWQSLSARGHQVYTKISLSGSFTIVFNPTSFDATTAHNYDAGNWIALDDDNIITGYKHRSPNLFTVVDRGLQGIDQSGLTQTWAHTGTTHPDYSTGYTKRVATSTINSSDVIYAARGSGGNFTDSFDSGGGDRGFNFSPSTNFFRAYPENDYGVILHGSSNITSVGDGTADPTRNWVYSGGGAIKACSNQQIFTSTKILELNGDLTFSYPASNTFFCLGGYLYLLNSNTIKVIA